MASTDIDLPIPPRAKQRAQFVEFTASSRKIKVKGQAFASLDLFFYLSCITKLSRPFSNLRLEIYVETHNQPLSQKAARQRSRHFSRIELLYRS